MSLKRKLLLLAVVLWMGLIFAFSNQTSMKSQATSDKVTSNIIDSVTTITKNDMTNSEKRELINNTRFIVRKTAHFALYFVLGILVYSLLNEYSLNKKYIWTILFCFLYACSDELHQLFLDGRSASLFDVFIDTCGVLIGSLFIRKINLLKSCKIKSI